MRREQVTKGMRIRHLETVNVYTKFEIFQSSNQWMDNDWRPECNTALKVKTYWRIYTLFIAQASGLKALEQFFFFPPTKRGFS